MRTFSCIKLSGHGPKTSMEEVIPICDTGSHHSKGNNPKL